MHKGQHLQQNVPTGSSSPKFLGCGRSQEKHCPLTHSIQQRYSYHGMAKELGKIFRPIIGKSPSSHKKPRILWNRLRISSLKNGSASPPIILQHNLHECQWTLSSTSSRTRLEQDVRIQQQRSMTVGHIIPLLVICLKHTYFLFQGRLGSRWKGQLWGQP